MSLTCPSSPLRVQFRLFVFVALFSACLIGVSVASVSSSAAPLPSEQQNLRQAAPSTLTIGGMFPLTGRLASGGVQREAAARIAVENINADPTILPSTTLEMIVQDTHTQPSFGLQIMLDFATIGVSGVIGAASSSVSGVAAMAGSIYDIPQISYSSTSSELSNKEIYPFFSRVVPPDSQQGEALARLCAYFGWDRVAALSTTDAIGTQTIEIFTNMAEKEGIRILSYNTFPPNTRPSGSGPNPDMDSLRSSLLTIKSTGAKIILIAALVGDAQVALREAVNLGMTGPDVVFVGTDAVVQEGLFLNEDGSFDSETANALRGMIGSRPKSASGPLYEAFLDDWEMRDPSQYPGAGTRSINAFAPFAYDVIYTFARAADQIFRNGEEFTHSHYLEVIRGIEFEGLTGDIRFQPNGDRLGAYDVVNHYHDSNSFVVVGSVNAENVTINSTLLVWPDGTDNVPLSAELDYIDWSDGAAIAMLVLFSLFALITLVVTVIVVVKRKTPVIFYASPLFCVLTLLGIIVGYSNVYLWTGIPTDAQCVLRPWFFAVAFVLIYGCVFAKTYRIARVFGNKRMKPTIVTDRSLVVFVMIYSLFYLIPIIVWTAWDPLTPTLHDDNSGEDKLNIRCSSDHGLGFEIYFLVVTGVTLFVGAVLSYMARKAKSFFGEAKYVAFCVYSLLFIGVMVVPLAYLLNDNPLAFYLIVALGAFFAISAVLVGLYVPKLYVLFIRPDSNVAPNFSTTARSQRSGGTAAGGDVTSRDWGSDLFTVEEDPGSTTASGSATTVSGSAGTQV